MRHGLLIKEIKTPKSFKQLRRVIGKEGFKYQSSFRLTNFLNLSKKEISLIIGIPLSSVYQLTPERRIGIRQSERLIDLDVLLKTGADVFGSKELFLAWLKAPNAALNEVPFNLLFTPFGVEIIEDLLSALEWGNVS